MRCALVEKSSNTIINFIVADANVDAAPSGHILINVTDETIALGWKWNGSTFIDQTPALPLADLKTKMKVEVAAERWSHETNGILFNGYDIATDPVSQTKIIGAVVASQIDSNTSINWKTSDGDFIVLNSEQIVSLGITMRSHVQACFDRESELVTDIDNATTEAELNAIDISVGWP